MLPFSGLRQSVTCTQQSVFSSRLEEDLLQISRLLSLCSFLSALRTLPTLTSLHSQLCLCNLGRLPGSGLFLPAPQSGNSPGNYSAQLVVPHLLGNTILHFLISDVFRNIFSYILVSFFTVSGRRVNSAPFTLPQPKSELSR